MPGGGGEDFAVAGRRGYGVEDEIIWRERYAMTIMPPTMIATAGAAIMAMMVMNFA
jgi:hypothetical protein